MLPHCPALLSLFSVVDLYCWLWAKYMMMMMMSSCHARLHSELRSVDKYSYRRYCRPIYDLLDLTYCLGDAWEARNGSSFRILLLVARSCSVRVVSWIVLLNDSMSSFIPSSLRKDSQNRNNKKLSGCSDGMADRTAYDVRYSYRPLSRMAICRQNFVLRPMRYLCNTWVEPDVSRGHHREE